MHIAKCSIPKTGFSRLSLFRIAYICTASVQIAICLILFLGILEMTTFHAYGKILSLLVVYFSHFLAAGILGTLFAIFVQWFRYGRSPSIILYSGVFIVVLFLILISLPLLTEQFRLQPQDIHPTPYMTLVLGILEPSPEIAFIYGLGNYALPVLAIVSWILTVSLLKQYSRRIGKKKFWLIVSTPLAYQLFVLAASNQNLFTDSTSVEIIYSWQVQFVTAINGQISGLFFAVAFLIVGRNIRQSKMRNFFMISSVAIFSLFSSIQPGSPFYAAYPPFGLVTLVFLGLSSYMLLIGIVGAATYVSRDNEVRKEVYKLLKTDSQILEIGMAETRREIQQKIQTVAQNIKSLEHDRLDFHEDPSEEDLKEMINQVLKEVHMKK